MPKPTCSRSRRLYIGDDEVAQTRPGHVTTECGGMGAVDTASPA
jgi:hypothetical protein